MKNVVKGTVYIVEDNESFRKSMVRLVQSFGYQAASFGSASDFLSLTTYQHPGCVLLDVRLPDIDGIKLYDILKQKGSKLPVIFMSGHVDISISVVAMKKGAVDFLPKPFDPDDMNDAITQAMVRNIHEMKEK